MLHLGSFTRHKSMTWDQRLYFPSEGRRAEDFFEHSSQVKDQGRWQCCHNKHTKFPFRPTHDVALLSGHAS